MRVSATVSSLQLSERSKARLFHSVPQFPHLPSGADDTHLWVLLWCRKGPGSVSDHEAPLVFFFF